MSRSGYSDDFDVDQWAHICYRGSVKSALTGKRGQAFLRETLAALDAMPVKELAPDSLVNAAGQYCTLGAVGAARGIDMQGIDPDDAKQVAESFGIAESMAREIVHVNDQWDRYIYTDRHGPPRSPFWNDLGWDRREATPAERWQRMRDWIASKINQEVPRG